ncbi:hemerythrin domain-containing protein [Phytohabitans sp. LJ34]|uniref:hemerythrin domain-containing protein n=1 Tax=Phytohabitans sp. LJ34 TaxID=3452217 RepID=UPI003F89D138
MDNETVNPSRSGEPEPNLMGFTMVHRAMLRDVQRLADVAAGLARDPSAITAARASALATHGTHMVQEIHHHHRREDEVLWPVIRAAAGHAVDLTPFVDDHKALDPLLERLRTTITDFGADPARHAASLAATAGELSQLLHEHIPEEEREVFPIIRTYVSAATWQRAERQMSKGVTLRHASWLIPWVEHHATGEERAHLQREAPLPFRILLAMFRGRFAARYRKAFS